MKSLNRHEIMGHLGEEPEIKELKTGTVVNISVATNQYWKDKSNDEKKERTDWHRVVLYDPLSEIAKKYLKKGARVYISGRSQTRKWEDKAGVEKYTTEIIANDLILLDKLDKLEENDLTNKN